MKSYLPILLVLSFLFTCCSKNSYELQVLHDNSNPLSDNRMSLDDAYNYISTNRGRCSTKGGSFTIDTMFNINGKNSCFLIRYNKGWELISADKRNPRVLMECSEGQINSSEDLFFNPTQRSFLKNQIKKVSLSLSSDVIGENEQYSYLNKPDIPYDDNCENREELRGPIGRIILNDTTVVTSCNHIVPTRWGQGYPWNVRAPYKDSLMTIHCSTGCTIVGVAQYLYFVMNEYDFEIPFYSDFYSNAIAPLDTNLYLILSSNDVNYTSSSYGDHYSEMPLVSSGIGTEVVSSFMVFIGYHLNAKYTQHGTSASLFSARTFLQNQYSIPMTITEDKTAYEGIIDYMMYHAYPLIAQLTENDGEGGHVVIIDALKKSVRTYDVYYFYNGVLSYHHTVTQTTWQIGINWGWNGNGDSISGQPVWYDITGDITNSYYDITYDTIKRILY